MTLEPALRRELLQLARASIDAALPHGRPAPYPAVPRAPELACARSSFVTLHVEEALRGCCGTLDAARPLAQDVWHNAWASAFEDPRFAPLSASEWQRATLQISVLSAPEALDASDQRELIASLRPGIDGLILAHGPTRVTFLPAVWQQLREPQQFVQQLKRKAGWPADFWPRQIRAWRYVSESFGEPAT